MKVLLALAVLMSVETLFKTGDCTTTNGQVLSIRPRNQEQVFVLRNISTNYETRLWLPVLPTHIKEEIYVHLFVPSENIDTVKDLLVNQNITYQVLLYSTRELIEMQMKNESTDPRSGSAYYEKYHKLEDIYDWINRTTQENPDMLTTILIGSSVEKRPIYVLKLSVKGKRPNNAIWLDCGIHAREWISPAFCLWFVQYSVAFYKINSDITNILDNMDVYVLPLVNPDGYKYTWTTDRMWRKNRSPSNNSPCVGADLNRNFDANWCTEGASDDPCSELYCGEYPESEPEAMAVANFLRSHKDSVKLYFTIHSYSQVLIFPYSSTYEKADNYNDLLAMTQEAASTIRRYYRNIYKFGPGAKIMYLAPGGSDDWVHQLGIKYSFTFELQDRGRYGFLLPPSLIQSACSEALIGVKTIANRVIQKLQASL